MKFTEEQIKKIEESNKYLPLSINTVAAAMHADLLPEVLVSVAELANATTKKEHQKIMDECPVCDIYPLVAAYIMGFWHGKDLGAAKMAANLTDCIYGIKKEVQFQDAGDME